MTFNGVTMEEELEGMIRFYEEKGQTVVMSSIDGESNFWIHKHEQMSLYNVRCTLRVFLQSYRGSSRSCGNP